MPAVHRRSRRWSTRTRGSRVQVFAQNMHHAAEGAFTGEVSAPMLVELGVHGVDPRALRAPCSCSARPTAALQLKVPAALDAGPVPILCVGETEEEREAGDTERKLRHQVQEDLAEGRDDRLGDVVIAYEPIWAIGTGTGRHARPGPGGDRVHPRAGRRPLARAGPSARGSCTAAASSPRTRDELLAQPDVDGALVGGASLDAGGVRGDRRRSHG